MTTEHAIDVLKNEERCVANSCRCAACGVLPELQVLGDQLDTTGSE